MVDNGRRELEREMWECLSALRRDLQGDADDRETVSRLSDLAFRYVVHVERVDSSADHALRQLEAAMRSALDELQTSPDDAAARGRLLAGVLRYTLHLRPGLLHDLAHPYASPADGV